MRLSRLPRQAYYESFTDESHIIRLTKAKQIPTGKYTIEKIGIRNGVQEEILDLKESRRGIFAYD